MSVKSGSSKSNYSYCNKKFEFSGLTQEAPTLPSRNSLRLKLLENWGHEKLIGLK